jgi:hypothetical protein
LFDRGDPTGMNLMHRYAQLLNVALLAALVGG